MGLIEKLRSIFGGAAAEKPAEQENAVIAKDPEPVTPPSSVKKAAVVGAGVMGSGIAAQLANAGVEVVLLDIVPKDAEDRSVIAKSAIERMVKANFQKDPMGCGFMSPENAKLVTAGNVEDDMHLVADVDLIVETVPEDMAIKNATFDKIEAHRKPGTIIASNTSTLPLKTMAEGRDDKFQQDFMIMHFFNPPRLMPLVELVAGEKTRREAMDKARDFCNVHLGKTVIDCKDTPGFLANRIGTYLIKRAMNEAIDRNMDIEDVDAVMGQPIGFPKMGIFGLVDTVGLNVSHHVTHSLKEILEAGDAFHDIANDIPLLDQMIADGALGRKAGAKGGFYRKGAHGKESIDLQTGQYRAAKKSGLKSVKAGKKGLRAVFEHEDNGGQLAWNVMSDALAYTASLIPEIGDDIAAIDEAMRAGYNWKRGPFEMIDALGNDNETGAQYLARRLKEDGKDVPKLLELAGAHPFYLEKEGDRQRLTVDLETGAIDYVDVAPKEGVLDLKTVKKTAQPLLGNEAGTLWDLGDGVVCAEIHGMKGTLDPSSMAFLNDAMDFVNDNEAYGSMVVYSDNDNFAVGANLGLVSFVANLADHDKLDDVLYEGQKTLERLKYAPFPVVGAVGGMALGGGCEILLHCDSIQAHAESYIGLVETGVGIIPGWGGCKEYLRRCFEHAERNPDDMTTPELRAFQTIAMATVSSSAQDAQNKLFLRPDDEISMNRSRLLNDAKTKAMNLTEGYKPPAPGQFRLGGEGQRTVFRMAVDDMYKMGAVTWHDVRVADMLGRVLSGGDTDLSQPLSDECMLWLERESFVPLIQTAQTRARVRQMVGTGKPLREDPLEVEKSAEELRDTLVPVHLKDRPVKAPWPDPSDAPVTNAALDVSGMKPMDAIIATLEASALPASSEADEALSAAFNEAAAETKAGTVARLNKSKGMAGFLPKEKLRKEVIGGFDKSIQKGEGKLSETSDPEELARLKASVETMKQYKKIVSDLKL